jgi:hypothetical protein
MIYYCLSHHSRLLLPASFPQFDHHTDQCLFAKLFFLASGVAVSQHSCGFLACM